MQDNFIYWQQAVNTNKLSEIAEVYQERIHQMIMYFSKNTLAQLGHMEVYLDSIDIYQYYNQKDYSQFLFDKTKELFDKYDKVVEETEKIKPAFQELAKRYSELMSNINL